MSARDGARLRHTGRVEVRTIADRLPDPPSGDAAMAAIADRYGVAQADLDGWTIAVNLTRTGCRLADPGVRYYAERLAARAVLRRAAGLVGPLRGATATVREPLREPYGGELDVEATLDNALGKPYPEASDWVVSRREERRHQVTLMVDTSLSMSGENMAIAAVAAAVLALKLRPEDLSVVVFEDKARAVTHLEQADDPAEVVRRMLDQPVRGRNPRRSGLLITDGVATVGGDPLPLAYRFPRLFVLLTEDYKMDPGLCRRLADAGRGDVFPVRAYRDLPARLLDVANRVLR